MKKRTVGIHADYDASEQTLCAEFLAAYIVKCYRYAKWFVPRGPKSNRRYSGFSHQWDTEVVPCRETSAEIRRDVAGCDTFFFFTPNEQLFELLPNDAVTAAVVGPGNRSGESLAFAKRCTFILMSCQSMFREMRRRPKNVLFWPFDPSIQCIPRQDLDFETRPKLLFPAFGFNYWERKFTLQVADIVKMCKPDAQVVTAYYDAGSESGPGDDSRTHDWRLIRYMQNSDWIIDLNPRPSYSLFGACAGGYGLQWIGFDLPPNNDDCNAARRHLIACEPASTKANRSMPDLESTAAQILARLDTPFHGLADRNRCHGAWENRRAEFLRVTNIVLGIRTKY